MVAKIRPVIAISLVVIGYIGLIAVVAQQEPTSDIGKRVVLEGRVESVTKTDDAFTFMVGLDGNRTVFASWGVAAGIKPGQYVKLRATKRESREYGKTEYEDAEEYPN